MHKINVISLGSKNFNTSLEELKDHLNFNLITKNEKLDTNKIDKFDIILLHQEYLKVKNDIQELKDLSNIIILVHSSDEKNSNYFSDKLLLPTKLQDINNLIESSIAKSNFSKNSSIKIKNFILNKNEKKLHKNDIFISLTEKEIQLLELLIKNEHPLARSKILNEVWKYSNDADTHTVETHIYRLRKKIKSKFNDDNFILNNKDGYYL